MSSPTTTCCWIPRARPSLRTEAALIIRSLMDASGLIEPAAPRVQGERGVGCAEWDVSGEAMDGSRWSGASASPAPLACILSAATPPPPRGP
eukprot:CAMPEP_0113675754 /NCGR_PEP_ID=MMETSP0038_2-20120614/8213_1 /TAXON_ID=2898 /ORGANISM="Cryptomonas paramecium" /LENGTH=91 /DNA_ID=CAMNT_0000592607 /DNA_START=291 /DNA_END=563 /DNA_ORIENTATION=- /assembly_acc=CAM_ASM_000170